MRPGAWVRPSSTALPLPAEARLEGVGPEEVRHLALVMAAAEGPGWPRWCLETASDYAKVRVQFGRPIGQFQAIKHALADMLVEVEQCRRGGLGCRRRMVRRHTGGRARAERARWRAR